MKKVHLIANAHIDPVWQWELDEGLSAAVSTFSSAAELLDEYDYIFCHNESMLYEWIECNCPELFIKISEKIAAGKWRIMGGWYLQPDCNLPCGESFVRQIMAGRKYFSEKFGVRPSIAANLDSFGHSKGLVQILRKTGYEGYVFQRPQKREKDLPAEDFMWDGLGGYSIPATRLSNGYNSALGKADEKIRSEIALHKDKDNILVFWGVGNHGGGPSRHDLEAIAAMQKENGSREIIHSTLEEYFSQIDKARLPRFSESLNLTMPGCLISQSRIKQGHRKLENLLLFTEKIMSAAYLNKNADYSGDEINEALNDLMLVQFHDALPGTSIKAAETEALEFIGRGVSTLKKLRTEAMLKMSANLTSTESGDYTVVVFNPHPYEAETVMQCELMLANQNFALDVYKDFIVLQDGKQIPSQIVKENSNIAIDWRKRVAFECKLAPGSLTQFTIKEKDLSKKPAVSKEAGSYEFANDRLQVRINNKGFIDSVILDGVKHISSEIKPVVFSDSADSWALKLENLERLGRKIGSFRLMTEKESAQFSGTEKPLGALRIIESGEVLTAVEGMYIYKNSTARIVYTFYNSKPYFDISAYIFNNSVSKCIKLEIPAAGKEIIGEIPFGYEKLTKGGAENPVYRFVAATDKNNSMAVINDGVYSASYEKGFLHLGLLRSAGYATHPIEDREYVPADRFVERMDQGGHTFSFRLFFDRTEGFLDGLTEKAQFFNERPYAMSLSIPNGKNIAPSALRLSNKNIVLSAMKKAEDSDDIILRLHNNSEKAASTDIYFGQRALGNYAFSAFEVKTIIFNTKEVKESYETVV